MPPPFPFNAAIVISILYGAYLINALPPFSPFANRINSPKFLLALIALILIDLLLIAFNFSIVNPLITTILSLILIFYLSSSIANHLLSKKKSPRFLLFHVGLILIVVSLFIGNSDRKQYSITLYQNISQNVALDSHSQYVSFPFPLTLNELTLKKYPSDQPKQIVASILIDDNHRLHAKTLEVNAPCSYQKYEFYLKDYTVNSSQSNYSAVIQIVDEPWKWITKIGICLLLAGAILLFFKGNGGVK